MRAGVEPRGFEMTPNVRHHRGRLGGKRNGRMRHVTVDVVDSEADALEMKRRDRTVECFRFVDERLQFFSVRLIGANEREEIGEAVLCRLPAVRGHVRTIVDCGAPRSPRSASSARVRYSVGVERGRARIEPPDLSEKGGLKDGQPQRSDERLFMQLLAFGGCTDQQGLTRALQQARVDGVLYEDVNDPHGVAVLSLSSRPEVFVEGVRRVLATFPGLVLKPEFAMLGRTYSLGYEPDLRETLVDRPRRTVLNPDWRWAVWYPLRRNGKFAQLSDQDQRTILAEHGAIGMSFGAGDFAHDIRLACHGLNKSDNDFVIGLIGKELFPLSAVVQAMRKTQQTALYLDRLGPFFVGRAMWQSIVG